MGTLGSLFWVEGAGRNMGQALLTLLFWVGVMPMHT